jgi:hypothetical protein
MNSSRDAAVGTFVLGLPGFCVIHNTIIITDNHRMPNADSLSAIAQMHLIQSVDTSRDAADVFKLPTRLRTQVDTDLGVLDAADSNTALTESDRAGGSAAARQALDRLQELSKEGFNYITAIRSTQITDAQRLEVYTAYGFAGGKLGRFNDARILGLSRLALQAHSNLQSAWRYQADLVTDITAQLAVYDANAEVATGGEREKATRARDAALEDAQSTLAQTRFYYCSASRDTDQTPELARIGFQPRRLPTATNGQPAPAPAATEPKPA